MLLFDLSFLMAHPDGITSAFMKLKKVFAALVLSTGQETVSVPLVEWLEYSQELQKYPNIEVFPCTKKL